MNPRGVFSPVLWLLLLVGTVWTAGCAGGPTATQPVAVVDDQTYRVRQLDAGSAFDVLARFDHSGFDGSTPFGWIAVPDRVGRIPITHLVPLYGADLARHPEFLTGAIRVSAAIRNGRPELVRAQVSSVPPLAESVNWPFDSSHTLASGTPSLLTRIEGGDGWPDAWLNITGDGGEVRGTLESLPMSVTERVRPFTVSVIDDMSGIPVVHSVRMVPSDMIVVDSGERVALSEYHFDTNEFGAMRLYPEVRVTVRLAPHPAYPSSSEDGPAILLATEIEILGEEGVGTDAEVVRRLQQK